MPAIKRPRTNTVQTRPSRRSTGHKINKDSPFADSGIAISDPEDEGDAETIVLQKPRKRRRSPSPVLSTNGVSDNDDAVSVHHEFFSEDEHQHATSLSPLNSVIPPVQLTFNVPLGHQGPFIVNLDVASLFQKSLDAAPLSTRRSTSRRSSLPSKALTQSTPDVQDRPESKVADSEWAGFLDLPAELRNQIYNLAFVHEDPFNFSSPQNFSRSAALLRTCRQIHDEGRTILYGENEFLFRRMTMRAGSFWVKEWNEVGFRSARRFLKAIGPTNTGFIRRLTFSFEDAVPSLNPDLSTAEERRFVHDDVLMSVLRHLADYGQLQRLQMHFQGRKSITRTDGRFLDYLTRIKADQVVFVKQPASKGAGWYVHAPESKQTEQVKAMCVRTMTRREKLYDQSY
ncbi:hypothetical protein MBLNU230_g0917t1 [Neophaeotheca triangularis]